MPLTQIVHTGGVAEFGAYPASHTQVEPKPVECALQAAQAVLDVTVHVLEAYCAELQAEQDVQLPACAAE